MIDVPIPVYIEYKNLSPIVSQAEYQKDIIATVLKKIEGQSKLILELENKNTRMNSSFFWEVKCHVCYSVIENKNGIIMSSVKKLNKEYTDKSFVYFDTIDMPGKVSSWKIELAPVKPILVYAGKNVKIKYSSNNGISVQGVGKSLKNAFIGDIVRIQVKNWFNKSSNSSDIIEAKVTAPDEVEYVGK